MNAWNVIGVVCVFILLPIWGYVTIRLLRRDRTLRRWERGMVEAQRNFLMEDRAFRQQLGLGAYYDLIRNHPIPPSRRRYLRIFSEDPNLKPNPSFPHAIVEATAPYHAVRKGFHPERLDPGVFWAFISSEIWPDHWNRFKIVIRENPDFPRGDLWLWEVDYA